VPVPTPKLRPDIDQLPAYKAGQRPVEREDIVSYKVSSNENPFDPLPGVVEAIARAAMDTHRYPDPFSRRLVEALSAHFHVDQDRIALGTGSVAICGQIIFAACAPGDEVIYPWRSFESYPIWTQMASAKSVKVPLLADERHDLEGMLAAITDRTRVIFICTPNNPTGEAVTRTEIIDFLDRAPSDVIVVIDEAYVEFSTGSDRADGIDISRDYDNVIALRTFSKAYGLASLRVGFAVAHPVVAEALRKTALPFGVSSIAEEAAIESLHREAELFERVDHLVQERDRVWNAFAELGYPIHPSYANFVWLRLGDQALEFTVACEEQGITIRPFAGEGVRISIAESAANDRVIEIAKKFRSSLR
jgi:histidinol-phosphate aminotransferase